MIFDCRKMYEKIQKGIDNEPTNKMIPLKTKGTTKYFPTILSFITAVAMLMYIIKRITYLENIISFYLKTVWIFSFKVILNL